MTSVLWTAVKLKEKEQKQIKKVIMLIHHYQNKVENLKKKKKCYKKCITHCILKYCPSKELKFYNNIDF